MGVHILSNDKFTRKSNLKTDADIRRIMELFIAEQPIDVKGQFNERTQAWKDILYRKMSTIFRITGAPASLNTQYLIWHMLVYGWAVIYKIPAYGIVTSTGAYEGIDFYYLPTKFTPSNSLLSDSIELTFGKDAVFGYLSNTIGMTGSFVPKGAMYLLNIYAEKLASIDCSIDVNLMNCRLSLYVSAETEAQAQTLKKTYDMVTRGEPLVVLKDDATKNLGSDGIAKPFFNDIQRTYIVDKLQDAKRTILNEFLTLIGIDNVSVEKRERVQSSEVNGNNEEINNAIKDWEENFRRFIENSNKVLGTEMVFERVYGVKNYGNFEPI